MTSSTNPGFARGPVIQSRPRRAHPGLLTQVQILFLATLVATDAGCLWIGHWLAHLATRQGPQVVLGPFNEWLALPVVHTILLLAAFVWRRMYQRRRPILHLDETIKILFMYCCCWPC